ncbi:MAG: hypothetical protein LBR44_05665 [Clostridiales Family XIII bacterium]|jgi:hypothetical protein|nr:hypothetical protein [Clostridiales Family XIII bacterium]
MSDIETIKSMSVNVDEKSPEFIEHVENRIARAIHKEHRLSVEEFAQQVKIRRAEKYGF